MTCRADAKMCIWLSTTTSLKYNHIVTEEFANGKYVVTRNVDIEKKSIQFTLEVETLGFVGFGLSPNGGMAASDIIIGGVFENKTTYFNDYHGVGNEMPVLDDHQDWNVESITENATHTSLIFNRLFDTCDTQDIAITEDTLSLIWSFGNSDELQHHGVNRGSQSRNLIDPPMPVKDISSFKKWNVTVEDTMPAADTSYICTIHKRPELSAPHHIIGFDSLLENEDALNHTHHFIFYKCIVPQDELGYFEESVGQSGEDCSVLTERNKLWLTYCNRPTFVWAKGGQITTFPENVGFPFAENPEDDEFFMFEIHYDNPKETPDIKFKTGMQIYYTDVLRPDIAGIMIIGHIVSWSHTIPPNSPNFKTVGHCASECTAKALEDQPDGINVFNVLLHSHVSGRQLKLRHFRGEEELPWVAVDQNYDFNYQQNRHLKKERKILKGDHLTYECVTNTEWKNGEITLGDLSTRDEMCEAFVMYYPRFDMVSCLSTYRLDDLMEDFGFQNLTMEDGMRIPTITEPENLMGRNYTDVVTNVVQWTDEFRKNYQTKVVNREHDIGCFSDRNPDFQVLGKTTYPNVKEYYQPENECKEDGTTTTESGQGPTTTISGISLILFVILGAISCQLN